MTRKKWRNRHVYIPDLAGPLDYRGRPAGCQRCGHPAANAVHIADEEVVDSLPPVPDEDVSDRILGEGP